jgi:hypothetical protein
MGLGYHNFGEKQTQRVGKFGVSAMLCFMVDISYHISWYISVELGQKYVISWVEMVKHWVHVYNQGWMSKPRENESGEQWKIGLLMIIATILTPSLVKGFTVQDSRRDPYGPMVEQVDRFLSLAHAMIQGEIARTRSVFWPHKNKTSGENW